jgi:UDP-MurNAc hydroxylase
MARLAMDKRIAKLRPAHRPVRQTAPALTVLTVERSRPEARPHYRITAAGRWVEGVRINWDDLLISFRLTP